MMPRQTLAEKYRRHREEFNLALELGCTPLDARHELNRRASRERIAELQRKIDATRTRVRHQRDANDPSGKSWMMQD